LANRFWPGLLSIIGTTGPFFLTIVYLFETFLAFYIFIFALAFGSLTGLLFIFARRLLVEPTRRKLWGAIVTMLYGLGYYTVVILLNFASNDRSYPLAYTLDLAGVALYILGPIGGVWGIISKTSKSTSRPPP
jgi:ABC-type cobalamin transport system permease subunit